jgi:hypothetical protein
MRYDAPIPPTTVGPTEETSIMTDTTRRSTGTTRSSTDTVADKFAGLARDTAYVLIGASLLTVQQLQVRRRELAGAIGKNPVVQQINATQLSTEQLSMKQLSMKQLDDIMNRLESGLGQLDERFETLEARIDEVVAAIEDRLPEQAGQLLGQAHDAAKAARKQVLGLIRNAA